MSHFKFLLYFFVFGLLLSCGKDDEPLLPPPQNLAEYIAVHSESRLVRDSLIACAGGGQEDFLVNAERPISIFFYPEGEAKEFRYFETQNITVDKNDLSLYAIKSLADEPLFNGYLRHFMREPLDHHSWGIVSFLKDGNLHISNPIRLKYSDLATEYNPSLLQLDQSQKLSPLFSFQDGRTPENEIYFHVITDQSGDLLSGTYTYERNFRFYDLSNVVLNIRDINPPPQMILGQNYHYVMMGVSIDNWVNLIVGRSFDTK